MEWGENGICSVLCLFWDMHLKEVEKTLTISLICTDGEEHRKKSYNNGGEGLI